MYYYDCYYKERLQKWIDSYKRDSALLNDKSIPPDIGENENNICFDSQCDGYDIEHPTNLQKYEGKTFIINRIPSAYFNTECIIYNKTKIFKGLDKYVGEKVSFIKFLTPKDCVSIPKLEYNDYYPCALFRIHKDNNFIVLQNKEITDDLNWKPSEEFKQRIEDVRALLYVNYPNGGKNFEKCKKLKFAYMKEKEINEIHEEKKRQLELQRKIEEQKRLEEERLRKEKEEAERLEEERRQEELKKYQELIKKYQELKIKRLKKLGNISFSVGLYIILILQCIYVYNIFMC